MTEYTRDEVEEILRRALETQPVDSLSYEDLVEAAVEAGIDAGDVEAAARQIEEEREIRFEEERVIGWRRKRFLQSVYTYVVVNAGLFVIDIMSGPGWWVQWVLAGWGVALALGARRALLPDRQRIRERAQRRLARRKRGQWERHVRKEVDRAIQVGVDALVDAAARKLSERDKARTQETRRVRVERVETDAADAEVIDSSGRKLTR